MDRPLEGADSRPAKTHRQRADNSAPVVFGRSSQSVSVILYNGALYDKALETLQARFGREEVIVRAHLLSLLDASRPRLLEPGEVERFQLILHDAVTVLKNLGYFHDLGGSENLR